MNWYIEVLKKYAVFSGRARRKEYWMFLLVHLIVTIGFAIADTVIGLGEPGEGVLVTLYTLALFLPSLAVTVRRLHDTGRSGWWALIGLIPILGAIVLLIFMVLDSEPGHNRFGSNPKEAF